MRVDGSLKSGVHEGSIHRVGALVQGQDACNGWTFWHVANEEGLVPIDTYRAEARSQITRLSA